MGEIRKEEKAERERERSERSGLSDGERRGRAGRRKESGEQEREIIRAGQVKPVKLIIEVN